jgi:hypothetical protein
VVTAEELDSWCQLAGTATPKTNAIADVFQVPRANKNLVLLRFIRKFSSQTTKIH